MYGPTKVETGRLHWGGLERCGACEQGLDCMPCDQWFWVGRQERPRLLKFPTFCRVHGPVEEID